MLIEVSWFYVFVGAVIGAALSIWRWPMSIAFGLAVVYLAYLGHWATIPLALVYAGEIISVWTGESWAMVIWRIIRRTEKSSKSTDGIVDMQAWLRDLPPDWQELLQDMKRRRMERITPAWKAAFEREKTRDSRKEIS
jgi:hypothetical protein